MTQRKILGILLPLALLVSMPLLAGARPLTTIGPVVNASNDHLTNNEITISLNPTNPNNVIAGWNDYNLNDGCGVTRSTDGGATWSPHSFIPGITRIDNNGNPYPGAGPYDFAGDPAVTFGPDGTAYFACYGYLYANASAPKGGVALFVSTSTNGGLTWGQPVHLSTSPGNGEGPGHGKGSNGQFPDHEAIAADTWSGSPYYGSVYVAQAQFHGVGPSPITAFYSRDHGHTWSQSVAVSTVANNSSQDAIPSVGPDGSVYVTFDNTQRGSHGFEQVLIAKSINGGASFGQNYQVATMVNPVNDDLVNSDYRESSYPASSVDGQNRLTVTWNDRRSGHSNMWYARAYGSNPATWTSPVQLKPSSNEQFFPWAHSAPNGRVDIIYYDRTRDPANTLNYVTYSQLTPTSGLGVTAQSFGNWSPAFNGNLSGGQTTPGCTPFIGDYIGITSDNTHVYAGWTGNGPPWHYDAHGRPVACDVNQDALTAKIQP